MWTGLQDARTYGEGKLQTAAIEGFATDVQVELSRQARQQRRFENLERNLKRTGSISVFVNDKRGGAFSGVEVVVGRDEIVRNQTSLYRWLERAAGQLHDLFLTENPHERPSR